MVPSGVPPTLQGPELAVVIHSMTQHACIHAASKTESGLTATPQQTLLQKTSSMRMHIHRMSQLTVS